MWVKELNYLIFCINIRLLFILKEYLANSYGDFRNNTNNRDFISIRNLTEMLALKIDWLKVLRSMVDFEIDENYEIMVLKPDLVKVTFEYLSLLDDRIFANLFSSSFIFKFYQVYTLYFMNVYEYPTFGTIHAKQRFEQCLSTVREQMPVAFTSMIVQRFTNKKMIDEAHDIANRTMAIIIKDVENDKTLPMNHKNHMLNKLKTMKLIIGYPEEVLNDQKVEEVYKNLNLTGNENLMTLQLETFIFNKKQEFKNLIIDREGGFVKNESALWIDYTTEDEHLTPTYELEKENTICKNANDFIT